MPLVPLYDQYGVTGGYSPDVRQLTRPEDAPGFWQSFGAAFRLENTIGSALSAQTGFTYRPEPGYDVWGDIQGTPYQRYFDRFVNINNPGDAALIKQQIDREENDRRILATSGLIGQVQSMIASGADWTTLLPGGAIYRTARTGVNVARSFLAVGAAAGAATVLQEAQLQQSQLLRTTSESALNIGGSVIIGGILGAGASALLGPSFTSLARQLENEAAVVLREANGAPATTPRSTSDIPTETPQQTIDRALEQIVDLGPSRVFDIDAEGNTILGRAASFLGRSVYFMNPLLRGLTSPSARQRNVMTALLENTIYMTRNMQGGASTQAVETLMKEWTRGVLADVVDNQRRVFADMRQTGRINMTYQQFSEEVGRAVRNGGSPNEYINRAAQYYSDRLFKPLTQQAIDAGLLPAGTSVDSVASGFSRVWNTRIVERNEEEFRTVVRTWADEQADAALAEAGNANARRITQTEAEIEALREATAARLSRTGPLPTSAETTFINMDQFSRAVKMAVQGESAPRPTTLTTFILRAGGIVDEDGLLKRAGVTSRTRIGLVRRELRTGANSTGGVSLDDAIELAFNGRFFETRPTREQFVEMLADDASGRRITAAVNDREAAQLWNLTNEINKTIERLGITPDQLRSTRNRAYKTILAEINKLYDTRDKALASELGLRLERLRAEQKLEAARYAPGSAEREKYVNDIVDTVFNRITGREVGDEPAGLTVASFGPMKEKTFNIPHDRVSKFLVDDVQLVAGRFARSMSADINLKKRFGSVQLKAEMNAIREQYAEIRQRVAREEKDEKARGKMLERLGKRESADLRDLANGRDLLRGSFQRRHNTGNFSRIASVAQTWNFIRALGGVVISSLTDLTRAVMVHGLGPTMKLGLAPLVRNMRKDGGFRLAVREARLSGAVGESILNSRLANWTEVMDPESIVSPVDRFMTNLSGAFSRVSGMVYWNDMQKSFASVITQNRILRDVATYSSLSKKERGYLAYLGIDERMAKRIQGQYTRAAQSDPHLAGKHDGVLVAGTEVWTDLEARQAFRAAINKDVDSTIVTRGYGDVPVFANTPLGRILLQFRSFALASHQRVLMRGVQENHAGVYLGMVSAVAWGMFIYYLRTIERGEEPSDNPGRWLAEGIDRSGLLSVFMEVNNAAEQVGLPGVYKGAQAAFPNASQQAPASRYAAETAISSIAGPTAGLVEDVASIVGLPWRENVTEADVRAGARLLPGRNLPGLKSWFDNYIIPYLSENAR